MVKYLETDYPGMQGNDVQACLEHLEAGSAENNDLSAWQWVVHTINVSKGWFDQQRDFGTECMLIVTEVAEIMEAFREGDWGSEGPDGKPEGVASECADVLVRLLDFCGRYDIDLAEAMRIKLKFNMTRPYKHGNKRV